MKKRIPLLLVSLIVTVSFTTGALAAANVTAIKAFLNKSLSVKIDGEKFEPKDEKNARLYPIVYNGKAYVPLKNFAEAIGADVQYNSSGNGTYTITMPVADEDAGKPTEDGGAVREDTGSSPATTTTTTKATGALTSPIPMNQKFTWTSTYKYKDDSYSGTYSCTVKSVKAITRDAIKDLGFKRPEDNPQIDYVMVTLAWEVKNAKLISASSNYPYRYLSSWSPDIWGVETPAGNNIIGGTDFGFDGSISRAIDDATNLKKLNVGGTGSFSAEGKVLLPILKNEENYLVIRDNGIEDYDKSKIHFKLK